MKWLFNLCVVFFAGLLPITDVSSQTLSRYTTAGLLNMAKTNGAGFINSYPEIQLNYALPLIDSVAAVELAKLSGLQASNNYTYAISLQCRDDLLKQMVLRDLLAHDKLCDGAMITKNKYDQPGVASVYEYWWLTNAMLTQIGKGDSNFLKIATKEFEFWAPMAKDYIDTVMKSGLHQLAIKSGKIKFTPCMLASPGNCGLWVSCIYFITGKEEYGSVNEQLNEVYRKLMRKLRLDKKTDNRKGFIRFGKKNIFTSTVPVNTLDSLDFEIIPELKHKFDNIRKKDNWKIIVYTHGNKGLLLLYNEEKSRMAFSKQEISIISMYLAELNAPSTIHLTNINYKSPY